MAGGKAKTLTVHLFQKFRLRMHKCLCSLFYVSALLQFYNAKISDFGLAALLPSADDGSQVETHIVGTHGYAAPEVIFTGNFLKLTSPKCRVHVMFKLTIISVD